MRKGLVLLISVAVFAIGATWWTLRRMRSLRKTPLEVTVRINSKEDSATVLAGSPVILSVFVSRAAASPPLALGSADTSWYSYIHIEATGTAGRLRWQVLGKPYTVHIERDALGLLKGATADTSNRAVFDESAKMYSARFAISPEDSAGLDAGRYTVKAVLRSPLSPPWDWFGQAASNQVEFTIQPVAASAPEQQAQRLADSAQFYLDAGRFEDALRLATQLKDRQPNESGSWVLLGDALNGLHRDQAALDAYNSALEFAAKEKEIEPPEYILSRWHEVVERLHPAGSSSDTIQSVNR
jgi:hypothetical protein